jgi:hypothetical protein
VRQMGLMRELKEILTSTIAKAWLISIGVILQLSASVMKWWTQACESAKEGLIPVLIYKYNRNKTRYVMPAALILNSTLLRTPLNHQSVMVGYVDDLCKDIDVILENAHNI